MSAFNLELRSFNCVASIGLVLQLDEYSKRVKSFPDHWNIYIPSTSTVPEPANGSSNVSIQYNDFIFHNMSANCIYLLPDKYESDIFSLYHPS